MQKVKSVTDTIRSKDLLDDEEFAAFLDCPINTRLQGLPKRLSSPSFSNLHELLGENWTGERVLDARAYQMMGVINDEKGPSTVLMLTTIFHGQLTVAYRAKVLSKTLKNLRECLLAALPRYIAFVFNKDNSHWAPCIISSNDQTVWQGDSLRLEPDKEMLDKVKWFLGDITKTQGQWTARELDVPHQGFGSGSCGIVALSAIHSFIAGATPWSQKRAPNFHLRWLAELIRYHLQAVAAQVCSCSISSMRWCTDRETTSLDLLQVLVMSPVMSSGHSMKTSWSPWMAIGLGNGPLVITNPILNHPNPNPTTALLDDSFLLSLGLSAAHQRKLPTHHWIQSGPGLACASRPWKNLFISSTCTKIIGATSG